MQDLHLVAAADPAADQVGRSDLDAEGANLFHVLADRSGVPAAREALAEGGRVQAQLPGVGRELLRRELGLVGEQTPPFRDGSSPTEILEPVWASAHEASRRAPAAAIHESLPRKLEVIV